MTLLRDLEAKIIAAINDAIRPDSPAPSGVARPDSPALPGAKVQVFGLWQPSLSGFVRNQEDPDTVATVAVGLGTPAVQTYSASAASITGSIVLTVRVELDPTGAALLALSDAIGSLLTGWNAANYQASFTALDTEAFNVGDVTVTGGATPSLDYERKLITVTYPFTISGCLTTPETTNP